MTICFLLSLVLYSTLGCTKTNTTNTPSLTTTFTQVATTTSVPVSSSTPTSPTTSLTPPTITTTVLPSSLLQIRLVMVSNISDDGTITYNYEAKFNKSDPEFVLVIVQGFTQKVVDISKGEFDIQIQFTNLRVYSPDGSLRGEIPFLGEINQNTLVDGGVLYYPINLGTPKSSDPLGEYKLEITATDLNSEAKIKGTTGTIKFIVN
jgi:hypothetical protein